MAEDEDGTSLDHAAHVERLRELAVLTQNPVYIWLALEALLAPVAGPQIERPESDIAIPCWIAAYLHDAAARLNCLATGVDCRKDPPAFDFSPFLDEDGNINQEEALRSPAWQRHMDAVSIAPSKAKTEIPNALGLVQGTRNMFERFQSAADAMQEVHFYDAVIEAGLPSKRAIDAIRREGAVRGQTESRILARIRDARRLM